MRGTHLLTGCGMPRGSVWQLLRLHPSGRSFPSSCCPLSHASSCQIPPSGTILSMPSNTWVGVSICMNSRLHETIPVHLIPKQHMHVYTWPCMSIHTYAHVHTYTPDTYTHPKIAFAQALVSTHTQCSPPLPPMSGGLMAASPGSVPIA